MKLVAEIPYQVGEENRHYFTLAVDLSDSTQVPQETCSIIYPIIPSSARVVSKQDNGWVNEDAPVGTSVSVSSQ